MLYSARWLLAPIYLGLSLVLIALLIEFFQSVTFRNYSAPSKGALL